MDTVLITGGSRGIGAGAVRAFCAAGYRAAFFYHASADAAQALSAETGACAISCDISSSAQVRSACEEARRQLGHIDVLINNAGVAQQKLFTDVTDDDWSWMLATNLSGAFYTCRAVLPGMISRRYGRIINVGSIWGQVGASCEVAYSASKAALIGMTKALAKEVGPSNVRVNCIAPGVIDTEMNAEFSDADIAALCDETPIGRIGTPDEIAKLIVYLSSDSASFITGQVISPNGGLVI